MDTKAVLGFCVIFATAGSILCALQLLTDKPKITYRNPKYVSYLNITTRRYARGDPYHIDVNFELLQTIGNNVSCVIVLYEYRDHSYRQTFGAIGLRACDLLQKNGLFGRPARLAGLKSCPVRPGIYNLLNMTANLEDAPEAWALYPKGRVHFNVSLVERGELIVGTYIDYELKRAPETARRLQKSIMKSSQGL